MIKQKNKSSLFLMELIIAILFFAISSAICVQVFIKARTMNVESQYRSQASLIASNIAEVYKSEQLDKYYQIEDNCLYFNESQQPVSSTKYVYKVILKEENDNLSILVLYEGEEIYSLECTHYKQRILAKDVI